MLIGRSFVVSVFWVLFCYFFAVLFFFGVCLRGLFLRCVSPQTDPSNSVSYLLFAPPFSLLLLLSFFLPPFGFLFFFVDS